MLHGFGEAIHRSAVIGVVSDRILTIDTMTVNTIALVVLLALRTGTALTVEIALLFALTGFVSTVAFCKHLLRGSIIE